MSRIRINYGQDEDFAKYIDIIRLCVVKFFEINNDEFIKSKKWHIARGRHYVMLYIREFMEDDATFQMIGSYFVCSPQNVMLMINKITFQAKVYGDLMKDEKKLRNIIKTALNRDNCIYKINDKL